MIETGPAVSGLEISQNRHLPCITKFFGIYGKIINLHWKSSKVSLALQPEALVNTSGRVDFSSPGCGVIWLNQMDCGRSIFN